MAKIIDELKGIPERYWLKTDRNIKLIAFYPFRDFYGGWLVYEKDSDKFKQFIGNKLAKKLGVKEIYAYSRRI